MPYKINPDIVRLNDILNAISDIEQFTAKSQLTDDRMALMAVAYEIAIIGEASGNLSDAICSAYPAIPWSDIIGMRHRIIHGYGKISLERLHEVVDKHLPIFKKQVEQILQDIDDA